MYDSKGTYAGRSSLIKLDGRSPGRKHGKAVRVYKFNNCHPEDTVCAERLIRSILGSAGKNITVRAPFHCDYGKNIEVGDNFTQILIP